MFVALALYCTANFVRDAQGTVRQLEPTTVSMLIQSASGSLNA